MFPAGLFSGMRLRFYKTFPPSIGPQSVIFRVMRNVMDALFYLKGRIINVNKFSNYITFIFVYPDQSTVK